LNAISLQRPPHSAAGAFIFKVSVPADFGHQQSWLNPDSISLIVMLLQALVMLKLNTIQLFHYDMYGMLAILLICSMVCLPYYFPRNENDHAHR
jgi:hypothetical protein